MVRKGYRDKLRTLSPDFWKLKKPDTVRIHDPKHRKTTEIQAVREIGKQAYYYKQDYGTAKEAKDLQKQLRASGGNAQIKKINNRHVVFSRKRK